jgi:5'-3' exonuclease
MSSAPATGSLYLVDAHALIFQVFHAIHGMTSPSGLPTNALFGFARDLLFLRGLHPDYLVCAFDRAEPTFRSAIYPQYKAHREEMPSDLCLQLPLIHRLLEAMNVPVVSVAGFEADDVLATLAAAGARRGLDVFLCSSDKDCRQLIDDCVRMYSLRKRQVFGREELLADWGIKPEQVVDLQTLVGDSVDNVPGVPGIGIKTAAKLLQDFGSLENILANIDRIPGAKRQESLRNSGDIIERARKLVRLDTNVPLELDWDAWRLRDLDVPRLRQLFQEWGFHSLANQLREPGSSGGAVQGELFPFGANADAVGQAFQPDDQAGKPDLRQDWQADYQLVDTEAKFEKFYRQLRKQQRIAFAHPVPRIPAPRAVRVPGTLAGYPRNRTASATIFCHDPAPSNGGHVPPTGRVPAAQTSPSSRNRPNARSVSRVSSSAWAASIDRKLKQDLPCMRARSPSETPSRSSGNR